MEWNPFTAANDCLFLTFFVDPKHAENMETRNIIFIIMVTVSESDSITHRFKLMMKGCAFLSILRFL